MSDLRRRLMGSGAAGGGSPSSLDLSSGYFDLGIVGESFHQDELMPLRISQRGRPFEVRLVPEPENPYDANAVAIQVAKSGALIGHLSREEAARYQPHLLRLAAAGLVVTCKGRTGGGDPERPTIGVWLDIDIHRLERAKAANPRA